MGGRKIHATRFQRHDGRGKKIRPEKRKSPTQVDKGKNCYFSSSEETPTRTQPKTSRVCGIKHLTKKGKCPTELLMFKQGGGEKGEKCRGSWHTKAGKKNISRNTPRGKGAEG